jgi:capsular exopolysaccharide synthesis family protein
MSQDFDEPNMVRALGFVRRRGIWIVLCFVLAAGAAFGFSKHQIRKYTATASLVFSYNQLTQEIAGVPTSNSNTLGQQASNLELLHLGDMAQKTAATLGRGLTADKVSEVVSLSGQLESSIAGVSATVTSPELAAEIANTYSRKFVQDQENTNRHYYQSALALVRKQLGALSPQQRVGTDGLELQDRAQSLELLAGLQHNTVQIAQEASVPVVPSSPKTSRNVLIGGILGLLVGFGLALLLERLDPRIRGPRELAAAYDLPLLGVVPQSAALARFVRADEAPPPALPLVETETFHIIRARLRSFNADRDIRTVLVTSATPGEGKTTVARHLASAAVRMGSRVLLLEADLRRPKLAQELGLQSHAGLADVLNGTVAIRVATQSIGIGRQTLDLLPSGPSIPRNPVELIESHTMDACLAQTKSVYDLVVIDAPELTAVSDAFLLLSKVDGVIIVGRVGRSRRDVAQHLRQVLATSGAPLVGVIANGVKLTGRDRNAPASNKPKADDLTNVDVSSGGDKYIPTAKI